MIIITIIIIIFYYFIATSINQTDFEKTLKTPLKKKKKRERLNYFTDFHGIYIKIYANKSCT